MGKGYELQTLFYEKWLKSCEIYSTFLTEQGLIFSGWAGLSNSVGILANLQSSHLAKEDTVPKAKIYFETNE